MRRLFKQTATFSQNVLLTPPESAKWKIHYIGVLLKQSAAGSGYLQVLLGAGGSTVTLLSVDASQRNDYAVVTFSGGDRLTNATSSGASRPIEFGSNAVLEIVPPTWGTVTSYELTIQIIEEGVN